MKKITLSMAALALLAGCGGDANETNPVSGGPLLVEEEVITDPEANVEDRISEALSDDLVAAVYDPNSQRLVLALESLDNADAGAVYTRNASLDTNGYLGFSTQSDALDRIFISLAGSSDDLTVEAVVVADGGQFNRSFGGGFFRSAVPTATETETEGSTVAGGAESVQNGFQRPSSGLVSFAGRYASVTNEAANGDASVALPTGFNSGTIAPVQPARIRADVFLNVDFADNIINGRVFNRAWVDHVAQDADIELANGAVIVLPDLPNVTLVEASINEDGTFLGETELPNLNVNGDYGGQFGGSGGSSGTSVAGITHITEISDDINTEQEYGVFVLNQCDGSDTAAELCNGVSALEVLNTSQAQARSLNVAANAAEAEFDRINEQDMPNAGDLNDARIAADEARAAATAARASFDAANTAYKESF